MKTSILKMNDFLKGTHNNNTKIFLQLLGMFLLLLFVWFRFFKQKIPRDIPFQLSTLSFLVLVCVCMIYTYVIYRVFIPLKQKKIIEVLYPIIAKLFKPLLLVNELLLTNKLSNKLLRFLLKLLGKTLILRKQRYDRILLYSFFFIMPKCLLAISLTLDCIYNKQLYLFYWCVVVIIFPLLVRYLLFFMERINNIIYLEEYYLIEITSENITYKKEDYDEEGFLKNHLPRRFWDIEDMEFDTEFSDIRYKYVKLSQFIEYQSTELLFFYVPHEYKILSQNERKDILLLSKNLFEDKSISKTNCEQLVKLNINLNTLKEQLKFTQEYYLVKKQISIL